MIIGGIGIKKIELELTKIELELTQIESEEIELELNKRICNELELKEWN